MEWRPRRNHPCQILYQILYKSVKGFLGGSTPKSVISYTYSNDSYNMFRTTVQTVISNSSIYQCLQENLSIFLTTWQHTSPPLDSIQVMVNVWKLKGNIIRTAPCWVVWHNVHSQQHTHMSSSYRSSRLGLSHWHPYAMHSGGCLKLYYCNMVEWCWWD